MIISKTTHVDERFMHVKIVDSTYLGCFHND